MECGENAVGGSVVLFEEDFEEGIVPENWTLTTNSSQGWFITQDGTSDFWPIPSHSWYMCSNDDMADDDGSADYLVTPSLNVSGAENISLNNAGPEIKTLKINEGSVSKKSNVGYLMPWNEYYTPKALNAILQKGLRAKVSMKNFNNGGNSYDYGTIQIPVQNQKLDSQELYNFLKTVANER